MTQESEAYKEKENMFVYELGFHLLPTLGEEEVSAEVDGLRSLIEKHGGVIISTESPKLIDLAYTMEKKQESKNAKFDSALFGWIKFEGESDKAEALDEEVGARKNVLRYLIIKTVRDYSPLKHKELFKEPQEEVKIISKPEVVEKKEAVKPISDEELDKTIEELVAE